MVQLTQKAADIFKRNPELYQAVKPYISKGPWQPGKALKQIEIIVDDATVAVINKGEQIKTIRDVPDDCDTYEIAFDRETVFFVIGGFLLINRIDPKGLIEYINAQDTEN